MITGGTGFIGYHTAQALLSAGHEVSLLVRSVEKMRSLYADDQVANYAVGDITDADSVRAAMEGCDALVHTAALVSTHAGDAERVYATNVQGTRTVIGTAIEQGLDAIVHVSSVTALFDPAADRLDEHSPPGKASSGYGRSKVTCEKYVRGLQAKGHPVYVTYPASVIGPADPGLTEPHLAIQSCLAQFVPLMPSGNQWVDVRDVAKVHLMLLEQRPPPGRYLLGGHYVPWRKMASVLEPIVGRRLVKVPLMGVAMRLAGRAFDRISPLLKLDVPVTEEGMIYATNWVVMDNGKVERDLGFTFRPLEESLTDCIRWLYQAGHITRRQAGKAVVD
jgi:nucleoside-diphosphate-sugar epimerase